MRPLRRKWLAGLALLGVALVVFATTADLLPHRHDNNKESVCPLCHPPLLGLRLTSLRLPSLTGISWAIAPVLVCATLAPCVRLAPSRGPPRLQ
jgi:hypothetical protein